MKAQIPITKFQTPNNIQAPSFNNQKICQLFGIWVIGFWLLVLGIWCLRPLTTFVTLSNG
jgi:hypothetical protein